MQGTGPFHLMAKLEQIMHHPHIVIAVISFVQVNGQWTVQIYAHLLPWTGHQKTSKTSPPLHLPWCAKDPGAGFFLTDSQMLRFEQKESDSM